MAEKARGKCGASESRSFQLAGRLICIALALAEFTSREDLGELWATTLRFRRTTFGAVQVTTEVEKDAKARRGIGTDAIIRRWEGRETRDKVRRAKRGFERASSVEGIEVYWGLPPGPYLAW